MERLGIDAIKDMNSLSIFKDFRNVVLIEYDKTKSENTQEALINVLKSIDTLENKYTY